MEKDFIKQFNESIQIPMIFLAIIWIIKASEELLGIQLSFMGVHPRNIDGILGIVTSPLVHGDWKHLISNSLPIFALVTILFLFYKKVAMRSLILIYVGTGLFVWLFAREYSHNELTGATRQVWHIGASGVVYGLISFLFFTGIFRRNLKSIVIALIILVAYGGSFLGILPNQEGVSWESHLIGGFVGIFVAFLYRNEVEETEEKVIVLEEEEGAHYFNRDVFELTKRERESRDRDNDWTSNQTW